MSPDWVGGCYFFDVIFLRCCVNLSVRERWYSLHWALLFFFLRWKKTIKFFMCSDLYRMSTCPIRNFITFKFLTIAYETRPSSRKCNKRCVSHKLQHTLTFGTICGFTFSHHYFATRIFILRLLVQNPSILRSSAREFNTSHAFPISCKLLKSLTFVCWHSECKKAQQQKFQDSSYCSKLCINTFFSNFRMKIKCGSTHTFSYYSANVYWSRN